MNFEDLFSPKGWNRIIKRLDWVDIGLVKAGSFLFGVFVASFFTGFVQDYRWWILVVSLVLLLARINKYLK